MLELPDARRIADAERAMGETPAGCTWLDDRTIDDLELGRAFAAVDRTNTPLGGQALWRMLAAPAHEPAVLATRERMMAKLADRALRGRVVAALGTGTLADAPHLPRLLWYAPPSAPPGRTIAMLVGAFVGFVALASVWPPLLLGAVVVIAANFLFDDWSKLGTSQTARALELLGGALAGAAKLVAIVPDAQIARDVAAVRGRLRRRLAILAIRDPFELLEMLRAALLVRVIVVRSALGIVTAERDRLRRILLWLGELDALAGIAALRAERDDACVPELTVDAVPHVDARGLVDPSIDNAIGNDLVLANGLLVTGSNMSGKSTLLRAIGIAAILAQSIHTTFGRWRASFMHVRAVMRIADDPSRAMSTFAVEVAAIGELVHATERGAIPSLFVIDEPFHGTNPTVRVPIAVAVIELLATHDLAIVATHDLEVATLLGDRLVRGYFEELPDGTFDRTLRCGIARASNAVAILRRAGYPAAILDRLG